jgi:hypothetical protein
LPASVELGARDRRYGNVTDALLFDVHAPLRKILEEALIHEDLVEAFVVIQGSLTIVSRGSIPLTLAQANDKLAKVDQGAVVEQRLGHALQVAQAI